MAIRHHVPAPTIGKMIASLVAGNALRSVPILGSFFGPMYQGNAKTIEELQRYLTQDEQQLGNGKKADSSKDTHKSGQVKKGSKSNSKNLLRRMLPTPSFGLLLVLAVMVPAAVGVGVIAMMAYTAVRAVGLV